MKKTVVSCVMIFLLFAVSAIVAEPVGQKYYCLPNPDICWHYASCWGAEGYQEECVLSCVTDNDFTGIGFCGYREDHDEPDPF